jgi:hypothetical protein
MAITHLGMAGDMTLGTIRIIIIMPIITMVIMATTIIITLHVSRLATIQA